jgi:4-hydroxybenzoate polyprenyltransferase
MSRLRAIVRALRPRHWLKNAFVLMPLLFGGALLDPPLLARAAIAALAFSLAASAVYLINDLFDIEFDRLHPLKQRRALASGRVSARFALLLVGVLLILAAGLCFLLGRAALAIIACLALYVALNIAYSAVLKHRPIVDIGILASGYVLRVVVGSLATGIVVSNWLVLVVLVIAFFLGAGKRLGEANDDAIEAEGSTRPVLAIYSVDFLRAVTVLSAALIVTLYSLYVIAQVEFYGQSELYIATVPLVILVVVLFLYDLYRGRRGGDPTAILLGGPWILGLCLLYVLLILGIQNEAFSALLY